MKKINTDVNFQGILFFTTMYILYSTQSRWLLLFLIPIIGISHYLRTYYCKVIRHITNDGNDELPSEIVAAAGMLAMLPAGIVLFFMIKVIPTFDAISWSLLLYATIIADSILATFVTWEKRRMNKSSTAK